MHKKLLPLSMQLSPKQHETVWLFVRVIDNFGDAGVAWRLAMNLATELKLQVNLWIDDLKVLTQLVSTQEQLLWSEQIRIFNWGKGTVVQKQIITLPDPNWVIEMFGCDLPDTVLKRIVQCRPLWLNWEYLSFEDWAVATHAMPSLQANGVSKYFWFMGVDPISGGLLRESDYHQRRNEFMQNSLLQQKFKQQYGLPTTHTGKLWLIFAYAAPIWSKWLSMWQAVEEPLTLWLAGEQVIHSLKQQNLLPEHALQYAGTQYVLGNVTMVRIPFVPQSVFDQLLWLADAAVVRGEESLVRALWAGLPFLWHIYPQQKLVHINKLHAFWHTVTAQWRAELQTAFNLLSDDLNGAGELNAQNRVMNWQQLMQDWSLWQDSARKSSEAFHKLPTAMEKLAMFGSHTLK